MSASQPMTVHPGREQLVCDCLTPSICSAKWHLTAKARAELLPKRLKEAEDKLLECAHLIESIRRLLPTRAA